MSSADGVVWDHEVARAALAAPNKLFKEGSMTIGYKRLCGYYNHPNADKYGVILEHRLVMSEKIGRPLKDDEIVHHINGDTFDNRPENLEIKDNINHARYHALKRGKEMIKLKCDFCGKSFERQECKVRSKINRNGQKAFYCSRICMGKGQWNKNIKKFRQV
jgi:hypothetical protein